MKAYIPQVIATVVTFLLLPFSKYILNKLVVKYGHMMQKSELRISQTKHIISIFLKVTFVFILAVIWGVQPKNLLFGLSSIFAVIGVAMFAQWSVLSNITAGIILFFTAPYKIGDRIHIIDKDIPIVATIESIQTFYTYLRNDEDEFITIPNNLFLQKIVSIKKEPIIDESSEL